MSEFVSNYSGGQSLDSLLNSITKEPTPNREMLTYEKARYGMLVEVLDKEGGYGYHAGCKIHFFNKKGVLIGNYYEFVSYNRLRIREGENRQYERFFYEQKAEGLKMWLFVCVCNIVTRLIRFTQNKMN